MTKRMGRPPSYRPEYLLQAKKLARLGATDAEMAAFFEVERQTFHTWKSDPNFLDALKRGKELADAEVAQKLYHRAIGYEHKAVKIVADAKTGADHVVEYTERFPPDTTACIFWLKNRRPDLWRDKHLAETRHDHYHHDDDLRERLLGGIARQAGLDEVDPPAPQKTNGGRANGAGT